MLCTEKALVKHEGSLLTVSPLRCRCWGCAECGPRRCRDLKWKARNGSPTLFLTLTMKRGLYATPAEQAREMAKGLRMLLQYLRRTLGREKIPYLVVFEKHRSGWPHMHVLLRGKYIDHRLIRAWWVARFASPQIMIEQVHDARKAAVYVSKYMAKDPTIFEGCKRYWCSRDWDPPKGPQDEFVRGDDVYFERVMSRPIDVATMALSDGALVTFFGDRISIDRWSLPDRQRWGIG